MAAAARPRWDAFVDGVGSIKISDMLHATEGFVPPATPSEHPLVLFLHLISTLSNPHYFGTVVPSAATLGLTHLSHGARHTAGHCMRAREDGHNFIANCV